MRIKKIKITAEGKVQVSYEQRNQFGGWDEYSFSCSEEPRPELHTALTALAPHVIDMCELPEDYLSRVIVRGVSFSYGGENEVMGATIIAQMHLQNSYAKLNMNTPHKASEPYSENSPLDAKQLLSDECIQALDDLCNEIELYINGQRAQQTLFVKEVGLTADEAKRVVDDLIRVKERSNAAIH